MKVGFQCFALKINNYMKQLLLFLLLMPVTIFGQKVEYFPKREAGGNPIRPTAYMAITPDNLPAGQKLKLVIAIHGHGERSAGTIDNLMNLLLGEDYNRDGVREGPPFVTADMKKAVNLFGLLMIVPSYESNEGSLSVTKINALYDWAQSTYSVHPKMMLTGFSAGGGSSLAFIKSSLDNANRCAYVVLCASTNPGGDKTIPGRAGLPVHVATNKTDPTVNKTSSQQIVADINATATLKALYTEFDRNGHGSNLEMWSLIPPKAPGGVGFTDAAENTWQVFNDIIITGKPRQMKSGSVIPTPEPPSVPTTKAIVKFTLSGSSLKLDGSGSTGWSNGLDGVWSFVSGPAGLFSWDIFPGGSSYIVANGILPKAGSYTFAFKLKGDPEIKTITVEFGKVAIAFDSETDLITYSDGSTEKGTAIFSSGKLNIKNAAGQIVISQ